MLRQIHESDVVSLDESTRPKADANIPVALMMNHVETAVDDCNELGRIEDQNAGDDSAVDVSAISVDESTRPKEDANGSIVARR